MIAHYHKLIYFLPIALATGPFLPDLIVVICSILFLIDTFRLKLFKYFNNDFFKVDTSAQGEDSERTDGWKIFRG